MTPQLPSTTLVTPCQQLDVPIGSLEALGQFQLLLDREQQVGLHADNQRALHLEATQRLRHRAVAMIREIEQVHGPRQVQVRIRVELAGELDGVALEILLDLEVHAERVPGLALLRGAFASEADLPFLR